MGSCRGLKDLAGLPEAGELNYAIVDAPTLARLLGGGKISLDALGLRTEEIDSLRHALGA